MTLASDEAVAVFIARWEGVAVLPGATELATAQSFVIELCSLLGVWPPHHGEEYQFERPITFAHGDGTTTPGRIDCYKRGVFVLEAKKIRAGHTGHAFAGVPAAVQTEIETAEGVGAVAMTGAPKRAWPKDAPGQAKALADLLAATPVALSLEEIAARFTARGRWRERIRPMLEMLVVFGKAQSDMSGTMTRYRRVS